MKDFWAPCCANNYVFNHYFIDYNFIDSCRDTLTDIQNRVDIHIFRKCYSIYYTNHLFFLI